MSAKQSLIGRPKTGPANKRRRVEPIEQSGSLDEVAVAQLLVSGADDPLGSSAILADAQIPSRGRGRSRSLGDHVAHASLRALLQARPPTVENVVCRTYFDNQMVLSLLTLLMRGRFTPNTFPACMANSAMPSGSTVSFDTGTTIGLGARNPMDCALQFYKLLMRIYLETGWVILPREFRIENVVGSASIGKRLDLQRMYRIATTSDEPGIPRPGNVQYEPSLFPGLHLKIPGVSMRFICFSSGYLVLTGGRDAAEVVRSYNALVEKLEPFVIND